MRPKPLIPTRTVIPAISFVCEPRLGPHDTLTTSDKARYDRLPSGLISSCSRSVGPRGLLSSSLARKRKNTPCSLGRPHSSGPSLADARRPVPPARARLAPEGCCLPHSLARRRTPLARSVVQTATDPPLPTLAG